jgi:colanic acid biosynthesis glycosyl transferase WcaI
MCGFAALIPSDEDREDQGFPVTRKSMIPRPPIIFIEQYYFPEGWGGAQIPRDITVALARSGYPVSVICGREQYIPVGPEAGDDSSQDPRAHGVSIWHVPKTPAFNRRPNGLLSQCWFSLIAVVLVVLRGRRSILMVQTNPPLLVIATGAMALLLRRTVILIAQDIYPEVIIAHGMLKPASTAAKFLAATFRWAYRRASCVVSLGPVMTSRLENKGVPRSQVREISNWATGDLRLIRGSMNRLKTEWGLRDKFVLLYSGNLGVAHDADTMLRAIAAARLSLSTLRMVIIGAGRRTEEARSLVRSLAIDELVLFEPWMPDDLLPLSLGVADMGVVTLLPGFEGLVVPSKLLGQMARGIPTIYVGPRNSDAAVIISESGGGITVENGMWEDLAARLVELASNPAALKQMGEAAASYYTRHLSREIGLNNYHSLVASIADRKCAS